jgi:hypothetical protein
MQSKLVLKSLFHWLDLSRMLFSHLYSCRMLIFRHYCQFVVESEEFPVNSFPLIIFDSSGNLSRKWIILCSLLGEFFDLSAFKCPETKLIFLVKGDANNTLYCQNYRVFVFLCIDCEHENVCSIFFSFIIPFYLFWYSSLRVSPRS